ncbi:MAG: hypothetical protein KC486_30040 [Myxococcales bacterium]|nr:hypothetical protein [Myxococcales bacterium]
MALGVALIAPAVAGEMPRSGDHAVHLARGWLALEQLGRGHLSGWSPYWYFGFPLGEFYPPLGDLLLAAVYSLGGGLLSLPQAYALTFSLAYVGHALATVRAAQLIGAGPLAAAVAGLLLLGDPGAVREGGWIFTVKYGVWLQPLACALTWWGLASAAAALGVGRASTATATATATATQSAVRSRELIPAGVILGLALLAHPIALPMIAVGLPALALAAGRRRGAAGLRGALVSGAFVGAVALMLASWWVAPLVAHRRWMSSYGQLFSSLGAALGRLADGQWTGNMPAAVGVAIGLGLVVALTRPRTRGLRMLAAFSLGLYLLAFSDVFFALRLDWLAEGFSGIQYQRFLVCAKPGLFIAAGVGLEFAWAAARRRRGASRIVLAAIGVGLAGWVVADLWAAAERHGVGALRLERRERDAGFDRDFQRFNRWAGERWRTRDGFYRIAMRGPRHDHTLVDGILWSRTPTYKIGFTPGETFVHKPESGARSLLERLRVRYVVGADARAPKGAAEVVRFGDIKVWEVGYDREFAVAEVDGEGLVEVLEEDYDAGVIRIRLENVDAGARLVFGVAGHPRWQLLRGDREVPWFEVPGRGDAGPATQAERAAGLLREGDPWTPNGKEPLLIAADVGATGDGIYTLRYRFWRPVDVVGVGLFVLGLAVIGAGLGRRSGARLDALLGRVAALLGPRALAFIGGLVVVAIAWRYVAGFAAELDTAVGRFYTLRVAAVDGAAPGPMKVSRVIVPSIRMRAGEDGAASITFPGVDVGPARGGGRPPILGWYATADETLGRKERLAKGMVLRAAIRPAGGDAPFVEAIAVRPRKVAGRTPLAIPTDAVADGPVDLRITMTRPLEGSNGYAFGFNLDLASAAPE